MIINFLLIALLSVQLVLLFASKENAKNEDERLDRIEKNLKQIIKNYEDKYLK